MPRKCGLPHTKIQIRRINSLYRYSIILIHVIQNRPQTINIPLLQNRKKPSQTTKKHLKKLKKYTYINITIRQAARHVGAVNRRDVSDILPVLALQVLVIKVSGRVVPLRIRQIAVLLHRHRFFLDVYLLIQSLFPRHDLAYRGGNCDVQVL